MTPAQRSTLFDALMIGVPTPEEFGKGGETMRSEMERLVIEDLDRIEPLIDAMICDGFSAGLAFSDRKTEADIVGGGDGLQDQGPACDSRVLSSPAGSGVLAPVLGTPVNGGRYDRNDQVAPHLRRSMELRQELQQEAPARPGMRRPHRVVLPSVYTLQKTAKPLSELANNRNVRSLIVDRPTGKRLANAFRLRLVAWPNAVHFTDVQSGVIIAIDQDGNYCGAYALPDDLTEGAESQPARAANPRKSAPSSPTQV